uniref:basic proline-rich protein-like n=1 Tax=Panthera onca TaxID=9690 RepID=UPI002953246F|nr:basic proline-rich protein-like [Panthera onca]
MKTPAWWKCSKAPENCLGLPDIKEAVAPPPPGSASSKEGQETPVRRGKIKPHVRKWGWTKGARKGRGQPPRWRVCRAARPAARHSPARSLGGVGRNARGAGRVGLAAQPERVREGAVQSPSKRRLRTTAQSWGGGSSASARGGRDKQGGARESGRPPPTRPARALALPQRPRAPTGRCPGGARLPGPQAAGPAPAGARSVGSSRAAPVPGLQRREVPAQLTSPRHEQQRGPGSSRSDSSAWLGAAAAAAPARPPGAAHRPAPLRPPARRGSVRAHLAGLPSLSGTLRSRTRPRPQPGPDSPPGKGAEERASQRAKERASGTHPPARPPPQPQAPRARTRPARPRRPRAHAPSPHTHRAPGIHTPGGLAPGRASPLEAELAPGRERKPESSRRQGRELGGGDRVRGRAAGTRPERKRKLVK